MNQTMRIRALVMIAGLVMLAACGEPLGKKAMLAGCEASAAAVSPELTGAALDYRAVVGREAILRFHLPRQGAEPRTVNVKCKVNIRGALRRIKIDSVRIRGDQFGTAKAAFAATVRANAAVAGRE
jgi:hypothetical protein